MSWTLFVMVAGVLQGLLLSVILLKKTHGNEKANRWLSAFIATFALVTLSDVLERTVELHRVGSVLILFDWGIMLLGPFILIYVMELTGERYRFKKWWFLHFLPAVLLLLICIPFYFLPSEQKIKLVLDDMKEAQNRHWEFFDVFVVMQIAAYLVWAVIILRKYSHSLCEHYSDLKHRNLRWLTIFIGVSLGLWIIYVLSIFMASKYTVMLNDIGFPIAAYIFGYFGLAQVDLTEVRREINSLVPDSPLTSDNKHSTPDSSDNQQTNRYVRSGLKSDKAAKLKQDLDRLMVTKKPYLDNDLNLRELAIQFEVLPHHLSQLLNENYGQNFFDFINSYRAQEVKNMLSDPSRKDESILSIAFSCGFNSKATFNSFFKKHTGQTPRQFRAHFESEKSQSI